MSEQFQSTETNKVSDHPHNDQINTLQRCFVTGGHRPTCDGMVCGIIRHILFPDTDITYCHRINSAIHFMNSGPISQGIVIADLNYYYLNYFINPTEPFSYRQIMDSCEHARHHGYHSLNDIINHLND